MSKLLLEKEIMPKSWASVVLEDLALILSAGGTPSTKIESYYKNGKIPFVKIDDITGNGKYLNQTKISITQEGLNNSSAWIVPSNSILYSMYASYGIPIINRIPVSTSQAIIAFVPIPKFVNLDYVYYFLESIKSTLVPKGTTQGNLNAQIIRSIKIKLPSLNEQKRIGDKIEELFSLVDSTKQLLGKTKILLKQYQRSILKSAFKGKLVPQDPNDESASMLLEKIRQEKSSESNTQANLITNELISRGNNLPKSLVNVKLDDIPETWKIIELQQISKIIDSLHTTPKYSSEGIPMVRSTEIKYGDLNLQQALRVSPEIYNNFTRNYKPKRNDIVMSRVGTYFVTSFVNTDEIFCMGQNTLVIHPLIDPRYLYYMLNSEFVNNQIEEKLVGTSGQRTISLKNIRGLLIFVPPLNEQKRIVTKIEESIFLIQNSERQVDSLLLQNNLMKNSILKSAFEGKLVSQDPNDEPAEILLEKIKQEKQKIISQTTKIRKKKNDK